MVSVTPNGPALEALRKAREVSIRELARRADLTHGFLSRLEREQTGASEDTIRRIAAALEVSPEVITRGDDVPTKEKSKQRDVPAPGTEAGAYFHYTPEEAADWLPWSALQLKRKAYRREIPFNEGASKITFTGLDIREISRMTAVRPLSETAVPKQRTA